MRHVIWKYPVTPEFELQLPVEAHQHEHADDEWQLAALLPVDVAAADRAEACHRAIGTALVAESTADCWDCSVATGTVARRAVVVAYASSSFLV